MTSITLIMVCKPWYISNNFLTSLFWKNDVTFSELEFIISNIKVKLEQISLENRKTAYLSIKQVGM